MFDPLAKGIGLLHLLSAERGDAMPHDLLGGECTTKDGCRQDESFGDCIIAFHIIGGIGFSVTLRLCFGESFCIIIAHRHGIEEVALDHARPRIGRGAFQKALPAGGVVVVADHLVTVGEEAVGEVTADEADSAGDEEFH